MAYLNPLHSFIAAGNAQAVAIMGIVFQLGNPATGPTYSGFFSQVDEKSVMELAGYIDPEDFMIVAGTQQFSVAPAINGQLTYSGSVYLIKAIKSDQSSYVLYLKKIQ